MDKLASGNINSSGWTRNLCRRAVIQLLSGLSAMHEHHIYHRDISEYNYMFDVDPVRNPSSFS